MTISHNLMAMNAQRQYKINADSKKKSTEKLSSGYKINRAADDAAGLAISEKMRRQIRGLTRGVENCHDGVSMCQIGDGALGEVQDMLHRLTELSIKSANGTNSQSDRAAIQAEVNDILKEINRVGETAEFNTLKLFKGYNEYAYDDNGSIIRNSDIPFTDFQLSDLRIAGNGAPFTASSDAKYLNLNATVVNPASGANSTNFNLIYGSGNTSDSSVVIQYTDSDGNDVKRQVMLNEFRIENFHLGKVRASDGQERDMWTRDLTFKDDANGIDITINQSIYAWNEADGSKNYHLSYNTYNNGTTKVTGSFIFSMDTAYNNNDYQEEYWINSQRVENAIMTNSDSGQCTFIDTSKLDSENLQTIDVSNGISVISTNSALPFSQNFNAPSADHIILGRWSDQLEHTTNRSVYEDYLNSSLGKTIIGSDKAITAIFENAFSTNPDNPVESISFTYGIKDIAKDVNIRNVPIHLDNSPILLAHHEKKDFWIQAGTDALDGFRISFDEMNTRVLGLDGLNVSTEEQATDSIERINLALAKVSANRSHIGAQQNRLESTIRNEDNIVENTTAAESRIRDTDMASEMVNLTKQNILAQVGEAMISQANQTKQGVLTILGS